MAQITIGRILPIFKGDWSSSVTYTKLDIVYYNGSSYVAKQTSTGQEPVLPSDYWMMVAKGLKWDTMTPSEKQEIINSVTAVLQDDIDALDERVTTAESNITSLQSGQSTLQGRVTTAEGNITSLNQGLATLENDIDTIGGRVTTAEDKIEILMESGDSVEEEIGVIFPYVLFYNNNGTWTQSVQDRYRSYVLQAENLRDKTVRIDPNTDLTQGVRVCFLKSAPVSGSALDFCDGESGEIQSTEEFTKKVPSDCSYIVFRVGDYISGQKVTFSPRLFLQLPIGDKVVELLNDRYVTDTELDLSNTILYWVNGTNTYANDRYSYGTFIPAESYRGRVLRVEPSETWWGGMRFAFLASLNSTTRPSGEPDYCATEPCVIQSTNTVKKKVPSDCSYIYVQVSNRETVDGVATGVNCSPKSVTLCQKLSDVVEKVAQSVPQNANGDFATLKAYTTSPFGLSSSLYAKDAAKRMMPANVVPFILIVGQSNADGRCTTADAPTWLSSANYSIPNYIMWNNSTKQFSTFSVTTNNGAGTANGSTATSNQTYSFDAYFAHLYLAQYGGQLYALKHTIGATPIHKMPTTGMVTASWNPNIKSFPSGCRPLLKELIDKLVSVREWASNNGIALLPIAILWHQGETDGDNNDYQYYKNDVANVWGYLRGCFGAQNIPILTGYINEQYKAAYSQINDTLDSLTLEDDYLKVVDMSDHFTGRTGDLVHYNESAISFMGETMFSNYNTLNLGI